MRIQNGRFKHDINISVNYIVTFVRNYYTLELFAHVETNLDQHETLIEFLKMQCFD